MTSKNLYSFRSTNNNSTDNKSTDDNSTDDNARIYAFTELSKQSKSMYLLFKFSNDISNDAKKHENDLIYLILANLAKGFEICEVPKEYKLNNLEELINKSKKWKKIIVSNEIINKFYNQNENYINDYIVKEYIMSQFIF